MPVLQRIFIATDLIPGQTYRVITGFKEYDGAIYPVGETWKSVGKNFLPYKDGLSMFVEGDHPFPDAMARHLCHMACCAQGKDTIIGGRHV